MRDSHSTIRYRLCKRYMYQQLYSSSECDDDYYVHFQNLIQEEKRCTLLLKELESEVSRYVHVTRFHSCTDFYLQKQRRTSAYAAGLKDKVLFCLF